ncbi:MAG: HD domain-containing protein [Desulfarculaceae bacterium]
MNQPLLAELTQDQQVEGVYLLAVKQLLTTKNGKPYGSLRLSDPTSQIEAKLWDQAEEILGPVEPGQAVHIRAKVEVFQGRIQLVLSSLDPAPQIDPADLLPASPLGLAQLSQGLDAALASIGDKNLKQLLEYFFAPGVAFRETFCRAPAAKAAHHAYVRGLLEHTLSVANMTGQMAALYPQMSHDLLLAGTLLHDIGKTAELTLGPPLDYTDQGRLVGHVVLGVRMLDQALSTLKDFPPEIADHLHHMILSHHGSLEFGSPVLPATAEALALHFADDLDAKLAILGEAQKASQPNAGNWSQFNRLMERFLWVGPTPLPDSRAPAPEVSAKKKGPAPPDSPPSPLGLFDAAQTKNQG